MVDASGDIDGDGMSNLYEYQNNLNSALDDTEMDSDSDGMPNLFEYENGLLAGIDDRLQVGSASGNKRSDSNFLVHFNASPMDEIATPQNRLGIQHLNVAKNSPRNQCQISKPLAI